ncbi:hypothetical protein SLE2022_192040 [Rubroshorea leprosula]
MRNLSIVCLSISLLFLFFSITMVDDKSYDLLKIVMQWQQGMCSVPHKTCVEPKMNFTMHGIWPAKASGNSVINCSGSPLKSKEQLIQAVPNLETYWPDVENGDHYGFWEQEWNKHGKCSEQELKQVDYFNLACQTLHDYDILGILNQSHILPNNQEVDRANVTQAIQNKITKVPLLVCKEKDVNAATKPQQLVEVILCKDKTGRSFVDCKKKSRCQEKFLFSKL